MKRRNRVSKWVALAVTGAGGIGLVAMVVAMMAVTGVSLVTPDPAFAKFDVKNLTIGGDLRVRGEFRRGSACTAVAITCSSTPGTHWGRL